MEREAKKGMAKEFPKAGSGVRVKNPLVAGETVVALRLPTDEQYAALMRRLERVRGKHEEELALADGLFRELVLESVHVDPDAADYLIGRLTSLEVLAAELDGDRYVVSGQVFGRVKVRFRFKLPSVARLRDDGDELGLAGGVKLFDELLEDAEGYAGDVPNYHKYPAVLAMRMAIYAKAYEVEEADFFDPDAGVSGAETTAA